MNKLACLLCIFIIYLIFYTISLRKLITSELRNINANTELLIKLSKSLIEERKSSIKYSRPFITNTKLLEKEIMDGQGSCQRSDAKGLGDSQRKQ